MNLFELLLKLFIVSVLTLFLTGKIVAQERWSPEHVYYGKSGRLTYTPDEQGNTIPDFSHVGYMFGDEPIPDVPVVVELEPVEGDNRDYIQMAINSLSVRTPDENGFRGAILLKKGVYHVSREIQIKTDGIVLRGEGDSDDGTVIIADGKTQYKVINVGNGTSRVVSSLTKQSINENYVPVGRKYVIVSDASQFSPGEWIVLHRPGTTQWIQDLKMDQITYREDVVQWKASAYSFYFERLITRVNGDTIFFRNPVVMAMETKYGGGSVYKYSFNRTQKVGIENIRFKSIYAHDTDENHAWRAIEFNSAENCWARNITGYYFGYAIVSIGSKGKLITVDNCHSRDLKSVITGSRRYPFVTNGAMTLYKNCTSTEARHDYVNGARVCGPNVFTNCTASQTHNDIGPHHRWAMGTLYDRIISDGKINVMDGDDWGTGHGWQGANQVFWSCEGSASVCENPWVSAKNYNFGFIGNKIPGKMPNRPDGEWVGHNVPGIFPTSLYVAQYDDRVNETIYFSLLPFLTFLNDTSVSLQFSLPVDPETAVKENLLISLSNGSIIDDLSVELADPYSLSINSKLFSAGYDLLTLTIKAENIISTDGSEINGVNSLSYTFPDLRPVVSGLSKSVNNVDGVLEASSTKTGYIYLVEYGNKVNSQFDLDSLVLINKARNVVVESVDTPVTILTKGLPGGYYQYWAVDDSGRLSVPTHNFAIINQTGPITAAEIILTGKLSVTQYGDEITIDVGDNQPCLLNIYSVTGKMIYLNHNFSGVVHLNKPVGHDLWIIQKCFGNTTETVKLFVK